MSKKRQLQTRSIEINPTSYNEDAGTIEVIYSAGATVDRGCYIEELIVSDDAIDTSRLDAGAVHLIRDHIPYGDPVGRIVSHRVEDGKAIAVVKLSDGESNRSTVTDIKNGVVRFVSVGYVPLETDVDETGNKTVITVKRWMPIEISLTPIPADIGAQTRTLPFTPAQQRNPTMSKRMAKAKIRMASLKALIVGRSTEELDAKIAELEAKIEDAKDAPDADTAEIVAEVEDIAAEIEEIAVAEVETDEDDDTAEVDAERTRAAEIFEIATRHGADAVTVTRAITEGRTAQEFRAMIKRSKVDGSPSGANTRITVDAREKAQRCAEDALYIALSGSGKTEAGDMAGLTASEIAKRSLGSAGMRMGKHDAIKSAMSQRTGLHSSSDFSFTSAAAGAIQRRVREVYEGFSEPLEPIISEVRVNDMRPVETYSAGGFPAFKKVPEGGQYEAGTIVTEGGTMHIEKYGRILNLSFEALLNDDLRVLDAAIKLAGTAGAKNRKKAVREAFGAKMADGRTLFHAQHNNVLGNVALDLEGLSAARVMLASQKGLDGDPLDLEMKYLIVGTKLLSDAEKLISPIGAITVDGVNIFANRLVVLHNSSFEGKEWVIAADPASGSDAIEVAVLAGHEGVDVEEIFDPRVDGFTYRARSFTGAQPNGWRSFVKSNGAN